MSNGMSNGELHTKALKVVSLLPSATELIAIVLDLAPPGSAVLVGRSHECDFPPSLVNGLPMLTSSRIKFTSSSDVDRQVREQLDAGDGLYAVDEDLLRKLAPDVICTQVRVVRGSGDVRTGPVGLTLLKKKIIA
jgi:iron complex transport system substrate-binding protein